MHWVAIFILDYGIIQSGLQWAIPRIFVIRPVQRNRWLPTVRSTGEGCVSPSGHSWGGVGPPETINCWHVPDQ